VGFILPGALEHFDLEDVRASLAPRPLLVLDPLDHVKRPARREEFDAVRRAYAKAGAAKAFKACAVS
jgi:hypothetical protein